MMSGNAINVNNYYSDVKACLDYKNLILNLIKIFYFDDIYQSKVFFILSKNENIYLTHSIRVNLKYFKLFYMLFLSGLKCIYKLCE